MKYLVSILSFLFAITASAETAKQVLDKTTSTLSKYPALTATFRATHASAGTTSGNICLQGRQFTLDAGQALVWHDGTTMWTLMKNTQEVNVTNPTAAELQRMNPYYFLNLYKTGYNLTMKTQGNNYVVTMSAQNARADIKQMVVTISKTTYLPSNVEMTSNRGVKTSIAISNIKKVSKRGASAFRFNQKDYPKYEVIDLR